MRSNTKIQCKYTKKMDNNSISDFKEMFQSYKIYRIKYIIKLIIISTELSGWPDPRKQAETPCFASFKH